MSEKNLSYFIDLKNFPIDEPHSSKFQKVIKEAQEALEFNGCYVLPSIINMETINDMRKETGEMTVCKLIEEDANINLRVKGNWTVPSEVKHSSENT